VEEPTARRDQDERIDLKIRQLEAVFLFLGKAGFHWLSGTRWVEEQLSENR
jgi:hypothetical protein